MRKEGELKCSEEIATQLRAQILIVTWHEARTEEPGHFQIDLVGHDGGISFGPFAFTLDSTDICSG